MPDVNRGNRPLSPHLQVYRPQLTSMSSILVRITGIATYGMAVLIVAWLFAAATNPGYFAAWNWFFTSVLGTIILIGATWAVFYHMLGRLRHVIWDFGYGLDVETSEKMAVGMIAAATVLTFLVFIAF
ncbi:MAG: succinate dehydrogenase, cytochrome b556 subunit [Pseudomonadota bacterium]